MKTGKQFEEIVQNMSAKEIIMTMVSALQNPTTKINMSTYGLVDREECYGCAATNFICKIAKISSHDMVYHNTHVFNRPFRTILPDSNLNFIVYFERAIDELRRGDIDSYNAYALDIGIALITNPLSVYVPFLYNDYTDNDLKHYISLANTQN